MAKAFRHGFYWLTAHADVEDLAVPDPEAQLVAALHVVPDWTVPYLAYMNRGELPYDEIFAR